MNLKRYVVREAPNAAIARKFQHITLTYRKLTLDLNLDLTRVHMDALGHTPTPLSSVEGHCLFCFFSCQSQSLWVLLSVPLQFLYGR